MDNIIDNLQSQDCFPYYDVRSRLLDPSGCCNFSSNGKAFYTPSSKVKKFNNKAKNFEKLNPTRRGNTEPHKCY